MSKATHTPEPWEWSEHGAIFSRCPLVHISGDLSNWRDAQRAVDCVNACAGMADPAAEIAAMRDALCRLWDWCECNGSPGAIAQSIRKNDIGPKVKKAFGGSIPTP